MKNFKSIFQWMILLLLIVSLTGCATIMNSSKQEMTLSSSPSQASFTVKNAMGMNVFSGNTPSIFKLERKSKYVITMNLKGYRPAEIYIDKKFNMWFCGNLICGGLLGMVIDAVSGAMYKLEPNTIHIELVNAKLASSNINQMYAQIHVMDDEGQVRKAFIPLILA